MELYRSRPGGIRQGAGDRACRKDSQVLIRGSGELLWTKPAIPTGGATVVAENSRSALWAGSRFF